MACIPTWSYDEAMYESKTEGTNVYIKTDPVKGKGLFARRALKKGATALSESAMCCTQNRDDYLRNIAVCGMCLVSCETPRGIVARVTKNRTLASELPYAAVYRKKDIVHCRYFEKGCPMIFCSTRCQELAWEKFHCCGCRGRMGNDEQQAHDAFITNCWTQAGVDYSDTHFLALRFLCNALTLHRLHKLSLEASYAHIAQLIKAPITKFNFSFLLRDDEEFPPDVAEADKNRTLWQRFQKYKNTPHEEPQVKAALVDASTKEEMLAEGRGMLKTMLSMNTEEADFYLGDRWSELLGAVLLNGQERTPHSPYYEHCETLSHISAAEQEMKVFHRKVKSLGYDVTKLHCSTSGQGIYTIGCLFNHSCSPNLQVLYVDANDETLTAVCLRDVAQDEELCISYINEALPYSERQQQLYEHYLFNCTCTKCAEEAPTALIDLAIVPATNDKKETEDTVAKTSPPRSPQEDK